MNTLWIFVVALCYILQYIQYGSCHIVPLDDKNVEVSTGEENPNILRLYKELDELNDLYVKHIQNTYNNSTPPSNDITAVDIVKKVLDSNDIGFLNTISTTCPTYKDSNGIYTVNVSGLGQIEVLCNSDIAGPGWTVVASRNNVELNFFRRWAEYKRGFGNLTGDFFIGLDKLHAITKTQASQLYIYLEDFEGNKRYARYDDFVIGSETEKYVLSTLGTYVGDMGDSLSLQKNKKFSTFDNDNDENSNENYAIEHRGAWWYGSGTRSNLFGQYLIGDYPAMAYNGMCWASWRSDYSLKVMRMMVRPKCLC